MYVPMCLTHLYSTIVTFSTCIYVYVMYIYMYICILNNQFANNSLPKTFDYAYVCMINSFGYQVCSLYATNNILPIGDQHYNICIWYIGVCVCVCLSAFIFWYINVLIYLSFIKCIIRIIYAMQN